MAKRAQGLPLNLIVLAIIAALVLVLIIAFTVGGAGSTFSRIFKVSTTTTGEEIDSVRAACRNACNNAELSITGSSQWATADYCKKRFNLDVDSSGKIEPGAGGTKGKEQGLACWHNPIAMGCQFTIAGTNANVKKDSADWADANKDCNANADVTIA